MIIPSRAWQWFGLVVVLLLPTTIYWNTISYRYGFRDDYSILRETHEEPGKVIRVCTSMGRPLYGWLLERSFARLGSIDDFSQMRLLAAALFGVLSVLLFVVLRAEPWDRSLAAGVAILVPLLPGSQVFVSWAIAWPPVLGLVLAVAGYGCAETSFRTLGAPARFGWWLAGVGALAASALIYQASCLFYLVPFAAGLFARFAREGAEIVAWVTRHAVTAGCGLGVAGTIVVRMFATGEWEMSSRVAVSPNLGETVAWFFQYPLPNALALFVLETPGTRGEWYAVAIIVTATLVAAGVIAIWRRHGRRSGGLAFLAISLLLPAAYGVNLLSTERLATYRTLLPLSGLVLVLAAVSLRTVAGRKITIGIFGVVALGAGWAAHRQAFDLFALPQSWELALIEEGARQVDPEKPTRIFIAIPELEDAPAPRQIGDEFGSLSTFSDWAPKEMFGMAMWEIYGNVPRNYTIDSWHGIPLDRQYDLVIDLRRLREFKGR